MQITVIIDIEPPNGVTFDAAAVIVGQTIERITDGAFYWLRQGLATAATARLSNATEPFVAIGRYDKAAT